MKRDWMKFEAPRMRGEWIKTVLVGLFLIALIHVFIGFPLAGWWPAYGRSAWPTMRWWTIPPYLSGYYHADYSDKDPEPNDIVWFRVPGCLVQSDIKRVEKVETRDGQPYMWLTTDNIGMTGEASGSDDGARFGWLPASRIIATVDDIWTPERYRRSRTPEGRFRNWVEFCYSPRDYSMNGDLIELKDHKHRRVLIYKNGRLSGEKVAVVPKGTRARELTINGEVVRLEREDSFAESGISGFVKDNGFLLLDGDVSEYYRVGRVFVVFVEQAWKDGYNGNYLKIVNVEVINPYESPPRGATKVYFVPTDVYVGTEWYVGLPAE